MDEAPFVQGALAADPDPFADALDDPLADAPDEPLADVYERFAPRVHDFLFWVLRDREEADRALADTFREAGAHLDELEGTDDPERVKAWVLALATHEALRRPVPWDVAAGAALDDAHALDSTDPAWNGLVAVVRGVADDMTPEDRAALELRYREGLGSDDLAAALGIAPDAVDPTLSLLTDRVEGDLRDTVVAHLGQTDCPDLAGLLAPWTGRLAPSQHALVTDHAMHCDVCGPRWRRDIPATALLGVPPLPPESPEASAAAPLPAGPDVDEDDLTARHTSLPLGPRRRFGAWFEGRGRVAAVAGAIVVVGAVVFLLSRSDHPTENVASTGNSSTSSPATTAFRAPTTVPLLTSPSTTSAPAADPAGGGGTAGPAPGGSGGGGSGGGTGGSSGTTPTTPATTPDTTPDTTAAPPDTSSTTTTTTAPPDHQGPTLTNLTVSPSVVKAGSQCTNGDPAKATVSVQATDASGVASVVATVAGAGSGRADMTSNGSGGWSATVGPFTTSLPAGIDLPATVIVTATDTVGNTSATTAPLTLRCAA